MHTPTRIPWRHAAQIRSVAVPYRLRSGSSSRALRTRFARWTVALFLAVVATLTPAVAADDGKLKKEELDQLLAPIALYPDDVLTNVLVASTYPLDVVEAERWRGQASNVKLKGDALVKALEAKDWDPSIKALVQVPDVLKMMSQQLEWTQKLGDAFLAQQDEVMDEIQFLRRKADEVGNLKSNKQQKVVREAGTDARPIYIIESATPETIYVPVYQPSVVYGTWWYPAYPPYYWPRPGVAFVNGFFWGAGVVIARDIWGWGRWDWHHRDIDIDVNKWNSINVNRTKIVSNKWEHRPEHRGPVPYKGKDVRDKFKQARGPAGNNDFRGRDVDRAKVAEKLKGTGPASVKGKDRPGAGAHVKDKTQSGAGANRKTATAPAKVERATPKRSAPAAFDMKRGAEVRRNADRGRASRVAMGGRGGARPNAGGGGRGGRRR